MSQSKAQQAVEFVKQQADVCATEAKLHNTFFGMGGEFGKLFPTRAARDAFMVTSEYDEIGRVLAAVKQREATTINDKAKQSLDFVRQQVAAGAGAAEVHNSFFGIDGRFAELFPTRGERDAFMATPEYEEIFEIRVALRKQERAAS